MSFVLTPHWFQIPVRLSELLNCMELVAERPWGRGYGNNRILCA